MVGLCSSEFLLDLFGVGSLAGFATILDSKPAGVDESTKAVWGCEVRLCFCFSEVPRPGFNRTSHNSASSWNELPLDTTVAHL